MPRRMQPTGPDQERAEEIQQLLAIAASVADFLCELIVFSQDQTRNRNGAVESAQNIAQAIIDFAEMTG